MMKSLALFATLALATLESANAMEKYLLQLPNSELFDNGMSLGHKDDGGYTEFGLAFQAAKFTWSADFCKSIYPGTAMTVGAAFGDPCCTWKVGGAADKTVNGWTDKPITETKCDATTAPTPAPAATTKAPTPANTPASPSKAPSTPTITPTKAPSKCGVKKDSPPTNPAKEVKSLDSDDAEYPQDGDDEDDEYPADD